MAADQNTCASLGHAATPRSAHYMINLRYAALGPGWCRRGALPVATGTLLGARAYAFRGSADAMVASRSSSRQPGTMAVIMF